MAGERTIDLWRIEPDSGGGVCLVGMMNGKPWQTSSIVSATPSGHVITASGTIYRLGRKDPGMWEIRLQMERPVRFDSLVHLGIL